MIQANPENKLSPLPGYLESYRDKITNFGLYFQKFVQYQKKSNFKLETQHNWKMGQRTYEWSLISNQFEHYKKYLSSVTLTKKHENQHKYLSAFSELGLKTVELSCVTSTRFLTGIGETTPTEVGMVFDRNTGLSYIPASSVKGAVRYAYCVNFARKDPDEDREFVDEKDVNGLIELFGSLDTKNSSRGGFAFMDVYSKKPPEIAIDIMNPHYGKYYKGESNDGPVETEEPVPIKFLAVEKDTVFKFRGFFLTKEAESYWDQLNEAFFTALTELGIGAKTAVGYGRFKVLGDNGGPEVKKGKKETTASTPLLDPKKQRQERLSQFRDGLPKPQYLPGQIDPLIEKIQAQEDETLKREMAGELLGLARSNKKKFKTARNKGKRWTEKLVSLCREVSVEV
jgi:CRISPR-associated protein Cmr6